MNDVNARLGVYGGFSSGHSNDGLDRFENFQEPKVDHRGDPLAKFVMARIQEAELEPRGEVIAAYDQPAGPMAHRYAKHVRRDCIVFRKIVAQYLDAHPDTHDKRTLTLVVQAIAERWSDHPDFRGEWRLA